MPVLNLFLPAASSSFKNFNAFKAWIDLRTPLKLPIQSSLTFNSTYKSSLKPNPMEALEKQMEDK